jgi:hypothetical protein
MLLMKKKKRRYKRASARKTTLVDAQAPVGASEGTVAAAPQHVHKTHITGL